MKVFFLFVLLGSALFAEPSMKAVAVQLNKGKCYFLKSPHAICILQNPDAKEAPQSTVAVNIFTDRLVFMRAGDSDFFQNCSIFRLRDSLEPLTERTVSQPACEGAVFSTKEDDVYLFCNPVFLDYLDASTIELLLQNDPNLGDAALDLVDAAKAQGAEENLTLILLRINDDDHTSTGSETDSSTAS